MAEIAALIGRAVRDSDGGRRPATSPPQVHGSRREQAGVRLLARSRVREYLFCLFVAAAVTYLATPVARRLRAVGGAMAEVRDRDVHDEPTPRLGGLGMAAGLVAAMLVAAQLPLMRSVFQGSTEPQALLSGALVLIVLGMVDDK